MPIWYITKRYSDLPGCADGGVMPSTEKPKPKPKPGEVFQGLVALAVVLGALHLFGVVRIPGLSAVLYSRSGCAIYAAKQAVEERLTSPGSAHFEHAVIGARTEDESLFVVCLVVDSDNRFGATIRNYGVALVKVTGHSLDDSREEVLTLELSETSPPISRIKEMTEVLGDKWHLEDWVTS